MHVVLVLTIVVAGLAAPAPVDDAAVADALGSISDLASKLNPLANAGSIVSKTVSAAKIKDCGCTCTVAPAPAPPTPKEKQNVLAGIIALIAELNPLTQVVKGTTSLVKGVKGVEGCDCEVLCSNAGSD